MDEAYAPIARRAAARLADLEPNLSALTERVLATASSEDGAAVRTYDPATAIAVASLLVSIVELGWKIYQDIRKDREKDQAATRSVLARRIRLAIPEPRGFASSDRDRLIEVVVDELTTSGEHPD